MLQQVVDERLEVDVLEEALVHELIDGHEEVEELAETDAADIVDTLLIEGDDLDYIDTEVVEVEELPVMRVGNQIVVEMEVDMEV